MMELNSFRISNSHIVELEFVNEGGGFHRTTRGPGSDISDLPDDVRESVNAAWTPEVIAAYRESRLPEPLSAADVIAERARRLAAGFDYDFGDERGVHRIGTTEADMIGWDEVTKGAQACINVGLPETAIGIVTDTGPVTVTATEWQHILGAATAFRQPIWHGSFALQAMSPIPADYATNEAYWTA